MGYNLSPTKRKIVAAASISFGISALSLLLFFLGAFKVAELKTLDFRFRHFTDYRQASKDILIVDINEESIRLLKDSVGRWPWPRDVHGQIVDYLKGAGARAIGFDIIFSEPDMCDPTLDDKFALSVKNAGNVYQASVFHEEEKPVLTEEEEKLLSNFPLLIDNRSKITFKDQVNVTPPLPLLLSVSKGVGSLNIKGDEDGTIRRVDLLFKHKGKFYPSFPLAICLGIRRPANAGAPGSGIRINSRRELCFEDKKIPLLPSGQMLVNYQGPLGTYKYYPAYKVFLSSYQKAMGQEPLLSPAIFKDKIVLVATSAAGLLDLRVTPFDPVYPGVGIHANVIDNILNNKFLKKVDFLIVVFLVLVFSLAAALLVLFIEKVKFSLFLFIEIASLYLLFSFYLFSHFRLWLNLSLPLFALLSSYSVSTLHSFITSGKEKRRVRNAFSRYVTTQVVDEILSKHEDLKLEGVRKELTVLFSDIRNFTTFSESTKAEEVFSHLNEYLTIMTDVVFKYGGTLDKYVGDEIMTVFGAPVHTPNHAQDACHTALEMMSELRKLQEKWKKEGKTVLDIGIGINTGEMIVGNVGSERRMDYTVIGDAVNLGARLEGVNKEYGTNIIISEFTFEKIKDKFKTRFLGEIKVKGKEKVVKIYELLG